MHAADIAAVLGRKGRDVAGDLLDHARIGFPGHVLAAEMLGQSDNAERDRHPGLAERFGVQHVRIALDPHQFGRSAADIKQDGATASRVDQRRTADHRHRRFGLAVDDF